MRLNSLLMIVFLFINICAASKASAQNNNQENIQNISVVFDKNNFDGNTYALDGVLYISERILFPAVINGKKIMLEMNIDRPNDDYKHPVIILTHGRRGPFPSRNINVCKTFDHIKSFFLKENLIVAQLSRRGAGVSEGSSDDEYKMTQIESGREMVKDIKQALIYLRSKNYTNKNKFVIGGHSQGGWAALTSASANLKGVKCIINFSGATNYRRRPWSKDWAQKVSIDYMYSCKELAKTAKIPSLWIYGDNDKSRAEDKIESMYFTYEKAGGKADLLIIPDTDHNTINNDAQELWSETVHNFLAENKVISKDFLGKGIYH